MKAYISHKVNFILITLFFLVSNSASSQSSAISISSPTQCYAPGSTSTTAVLINTVSGATSYTWAVTGPCNPTVTSSGTLVSVSYPCCGSFTYACTALNGTTVIGVYYDVATVYCTPTVQISGSSVVCAGQSTTLQALGASSYTWFPGSTNSAFIVVNPTVTTTYTVLGTTGACGTSSATTTVSIAQAPTLTITASSSSVCAGTTVTLTASGASSYTWSGGSLSPSFTTNVSSSSSFTVTGTSTAGCAGSSVKTISVSTPGFINAFSTHSFVCPGYAATLTASGASNYTWTNGPLASTYVIYPTVSTSYTVSGYTGACLVTATLFVAVSPVPVVSVLPANAQTLCAGATTTLSASGAQSYTWSTGSTSAIITLTPNTSGNYFVLGLNSSGCLDTGFVSLNVVPLVSPNFNYTQGANGQIQFINTSTGTLSSTSYSWSFGNGQSSTTNSPGTTYSVNGTYFVTLVANNGCGPVSVTHTVIVSTLGGGCSASFTTNPGIYGIYSFTSTSGGTNANTLFTWNFGNGSGTYTSTGSSGITPPIQTYLSGTYTVSLMISNSNPPCSDTASMVIQVCSEHSQFLKTQLSNATYSFSSTATGTGAATTFSWSYGDGSGSTGSTSVHSYTAPGTYSVYLKVSNSSSCVSTALQVLTINACSLSSNFTHTLGTNGIVNFSNTSSYSSNFPVNQIWDFGDGVFSLVSNPTHTFYTAGTYNVRLILKDSSSFCVDTLIQSINVTGISCVAYSNFTLLPTNTPQYWSAVPGYPWNITAASWSWGDGVTTNSLYASHTYSAAGTYSICLSVTVSCGASSTYCYSYYVNKSNDESSQVVHINVLPPEKTNGIQVLSKNDIAFTIYPNPNNGAFTINLSQLTTDKISIAVFSLLGELVYFSDESGDSEIRTISLPELNSGIYFVRLSSGASARTEKIIISR